MSGDGSVQPYQSRTRAAMTEVRRNNQSLRNTLLAMRNGMGLMQGEIAERKRAREEDREAKATQSSSNLKQIKTEDSASDRPALFRKP